MKFVAVLNREGGTLRTLDLEAFCARAAAVFAAHGHALECEIVDGASVGETLARVARSPGIDVMMAGGGDGTVSAAAKCAFEAGRTLAVLPAGTMNLFARALGLPLDLDAALEAIARGTPGAVDIATANGHAFVHQFGVGIHARLVRIRDRLTYGSRTGKMLASLYAITAAIVAPPRFEVEIRTPRGRETRATSGIAVSNNPLGEGHFPHADALDAGVLGVYVADPMRTSDLAVLFAEVMMGSWRHNPMIWEREVSEVTLRFPSRKRFAQAVVDGELIALEKEVRIVLHARALRVILPPRDEPAAP